MAVLPPTPPQQQIAADPLSHQPSNGNPSLSYSEGFPLVMLPEEEQKEIVAICQQLKTIWKTHAQEKKHKMAQAYGYINNQLQAGDLLPDRSSTDGSDRDANPNRPEIFFPISREQYKLLYSYLKLTFFPTDEDFFRIRGKTAKAASGEDDLTEAVKYVFKENNIVRQLGQWLSQIIVYGIGVIYPTFSSHPSFAWTINPEEKQFEPQLQGGNKELILEVWNALHFYIDPVAKNPKDAKWGYFCLKKLQMVLDSPYYINKDKLEAVAIKTPQENDPLEQNAIAQYEGLTYPLLDGDKNLYIDHYYFPHLKLEQSGKEYRNFFVSVAQSQVLIEFRPNITPKGESPAIYWTWADEISGPYGLGPIEEIAPLQQLYNIVGNYMIETMARIGNLWVVQEDVDLANWFGTAGGIATARNPQTDVVSISGNLSEIKVLMDFLMTIRTEMQTLAGAQAPFPQQSNVQFKAKTATEVQVGQENAISYLREIVEHVSGGIEQVLNRCLLILGDVYEEPIQIRVNDPIKGTRYIESDFKVFQSGEYTIELIGANPTQSKQVQVEALQQLIQLIAGNPQGAQLVEPILIELGVLMGIKNIQEILNDVKQNAQAMMQGQQAGAQGQPQQQGQDGQTPGAGQLSQQGMQQGQMMQ